VERDVAIEKVSTNPQPHADDGDRHLKRRAPRHHRWAEQDVDDHAATADRDHREVKTDPRADRGGQTGGAQQQQPHRIHRSGGS
jgi:hypothetical protein